MAGAAVDIVGTAGVDIIPITTLFNERLKAQVLPGADRIGDELGAAIARTMSAQSPPQSRRPLPTGQRPRRRMQSSKGRQRVAPSPTRCGPS